MNFLQDKPIFSLTVDSKDISFVLHINGVLIYQWYESDPISELNIPINHFFRSGKNELSIVLLPEDDCSEFNENAQLDVKLKAKNFGGKEGITLVETVFSPYNDDFFVKSSPAGNYELGSQLESDKTGDIVVGEIRTDSVADCDGGIHAFRSFDIPSSLPLWSFFDESNDSFPSPLTYADDEYDAAVSQLMPEYKAIAQAIEAGNIDEILSRFEERSREMDLAYYEPAGTTQQQLKKALLEVANDSSIKLVPFEVENLAFALHENPKIVELTMDGGAAIGANLEEGGSVDYPIIFRRQAGKWIITR